MAASDAQRVIKLEEVREHSTNQSLWIVIANDVYDVTKFMDEHPGGEEVLIEAGGSDGTESFEDVGHSQDAREMMKDYKIGTVCDEDRTDIKKRPPIVFAGADGESGWLWRFLFPVALGLTLAVVYSYMK